MDLFPSSRVVGRVPTELSPLERASHDHWTQQEVLSSTVILLTSKFHQEGIRTEKLPAEWEPFAVCF